MSHGYLTPPQASCTDETTAGYHDGMKKTGLLALMPILLAADCFQPEEEPVPIYSEGGGVWEADADTDTDTDADTDADADSGK